MQEASHHASPFMLSLINHLSILSVGSLSGLQVDRPCRLFSVEDGNRYFSLLTKEKE